MSTLILLGASVRALAQSVLRAGLSPYSIDCYADRDCAALGPSIKIGRFPQGFLTALAAAPAAPWLYTGGLENYPRLIDRLARMRPLLGNCGRTLQRARDPLILQAVTAQAGLPFPQTIGDGTRRPDLRSGDWLIKPLRSSGGAGVRFAEKRDLARKPFSAYLQQYIDGEAASAVFAAAGGRATLLGTTRQLLGRDFGLSRPFLYVGSIGPLALGERELAPLNKLADLLVQQLALVGLFNIDFIRNASGIWPLELNPRYSASVEIIERFTDVAAIDGHVAACTHGVLRRLIATSGHCAGKAVVYAQRDGIVPAALDELIDRWNVTGRSPRLADLPRVGDQLEMDQPILTVIAEGDSLEAVEAQLRADVAAIHDLF